jgi:hypothetical protein
MPQTQPLNPISSLPAIPAGCRAAIARNALGAAVTILAICAIALAEGRADDAFESTIPSRGIECPHDRPAEATVAAVAAANHRTFPASLDEKLAGRVQVWKIIVLGAHDRTGALRAALDARCRVGGLARAMLDASAFTADRAPRQVDLVVLSAAEMGFKGESVSRAAVYRRAAQLGLALCPSEVGPQLRLQYPDQPAGEFLHIAMRPIVTRQGEHAAFIVGNGGAGLLLIGSEARLERSAPARQRFVFTRPR